MAVRTSTGHPVCVGSIVRVLAVPPDVASMPAETKRAFRAAVGHRFKIRGIRRAALLIELDVSRRVVPLVSGFGHSIWVEPEFLAQS